MWKLTQKLSLIAAIANCAVASVAQSDTVNLVERGRYLATIGVCEACHTPPAVASGPAACTNTEKQRDRNLRTNPDWILYLDNNKRMAGGVPFILRFGSDSSGVVVSSNITQDTETGIGSWSDAQIMEVIRSGKRPDGSYIFRFPPHTFYEYLAEDDLKAIVSYVKTFGSVKNKIKARELPFNPNSSNPGAIPATAPKGRTHDRADYLMRALVGCKECHSHHDGSGQLRPFIGGDPSDAFAGVFRLGPDLPLRQEEKGLATFPYPGFSVVYGGNLTRFGKGGDLANTPVDTIVRAIRDGVATHPDEYGRPRPLAHVMMWQFYKNMSYDDAAAIADFLKGLPYTQHDIGDRFRNFGTDWEAAFKQAFGTDPSVNDRRIFGYGSGRVQSCAN